MALARELLSAFVSFLGFALDNNPPQQQTSKLPLARSFFLLLPTVRYVPQARLSTQSQTTI